MSQTIAETKIRAKRVATDILPQGAKKQKVVHSEVVSATGKKIMLDPSQAVGYDGKQAYVQEVMTPAPATTALQQTASFSFNIENDATGKLKDAMFRFAITPTGAAEACYAPVPLWFDRIEYFDRHSGQEIARYHGDILFWLILTLPAHILKVVGPMMNMNPCGPNYGGKVFDDITNDAGSPATGLIQIRSVQRYFYLMLPHNIVPAMELDMSDMEGDLEVKFWPKGNIRSEQVTTSIPTLNEIRLISSTELSTARNAMAVKARADSLVHQTNYLDFQQFTITGAALVAGQAYDINLDQFHHKSAFLLFCIRPDDTNTTSDTYATTAPVCLLDANNRATQYVSLGKKGTIDHLNVTGRSLLGTGTPLNAEYVQKLITSQIVGKWAECNSVYCIPFSHDLAAAVNGEIDGYHDFKGERERIRIVPDSTATVYAEQKFTNIVEMKVGAIQFGYKGDRHNTWLTYDATAAAIQTAINSIQTLANEGIRVLCTAGQTPADDMTITFMTTSGGYVDMKGVGLSIHINVTNDGSWYNLTGVTPGTPGFTTGAATGYQIDVYSAYYRTVKQDSGRLAMDDL